MMIIRTLMFIIILLITFVFGCVSNSITQVQADDKVGLTNGPTIQQNNTDIMGKRYSIDELREDMDQLRKIILYDLPQKPFADMDEIVKLFKTQSLLLHDNMSELEFYRVVNPIIVKLHCGHSRLNLSKEYISLLNKNSRYFPIVARVIADRIYIYHGFGTDIPKGSEILAMNGKSSKDIIDHLLNNTVSDGSNLTNKYYRINQYFQDYYYEYIDCSDGFDITYLPENTHQICHAKLTAITKEQLNNAFKQFLPTSEKDRTPYYGEFTPEFAVLTVKTFAIWDDGAVQKFKDFINQFFTDLSRRKSSNLILDLRNNGGGNAFCSSFLYSYLITEASPYLSKKSIIPYSRFPLMVPIEPNSNHFTGNLYILINGGSFSNTGLLSSLLKYHHIGIFLGEESGGSYMCGMSSNFEFVLKHTRIRLPNNPYTMITPGSGLTFGRGIFPDYPVVPTLDDYLQCREVEKEFAVKLIKGNS